MPRPLPHRFTPSVDGTPGCNSGDCGLPLGNAVHQPAPDHDPSGTILGHVDRPSARVGHRHPTTSQDAAVNALPRSGTIRRRIFTLIVEDPRGATDDELEIRLDRTHQSVSAARNSLMRDGLIEATLDDDGKPVTRRTRSGNDAIVWRPTAPAAALARGEGVLV